MNYKSPMGWNSWNSFRMECKRWLTVSIVRDSNLECIPAQDLKPVPVIPAAMDMNSRMRSNLQNGVYAVFPVVAFPKDLHKRLT